MTDARWVARAPGSFMEVNAPLSRRPDTPGPPPSSRRKTRTRVFAALVAAAGLLPGCGGTDKADPAPTADRGTLTEIGIETRRWHIRAPLGPFLRSLGERSLGDSVLPASDRLAWRDAGLRLIDVPVADIDGLESAAPHTDAVRRAWLGQPTAWTPLVSRATPAGDDPGAFGLAGTTTHLLARSWVEPDVRLGPVFRVELAVARTDPAAREPGRPAVVGGLLLSCVLEPERALLVVPADPGEDWTVPEPEAESEAEPGDAADGERDAGAGPEPGDNEGGAGSEPGTGTDRIGIAPLPAPVADEGADGGRSGGGPAMGPEESGPVPQGGRTVGESLLLRPPQLTGDRPRPARRTIFAIVPSWPSSGAGAEAEPARSR